MKISSIQTICCHHSTLCLLFPSFHLSMFQDLREYDHHRLFPVQLWETLLQKCDSLISCSSGAYVCTQAREGVDYMWPLEHSVDEINRARWAMYWHHKHCTLSCSHAIKVEVGGAQVNFSESWRKFDEQTWQLASSFWLEVTKVHLINCSMSHCKMHHSSLITQGDACTLKRANILIAACICLNKLWNFIQFTFSSSCRLLCYRILQLNTILSHNIFVQSHEWELRFCTLSIYSSWNWNLNMFWYTAKNCASFQKYVNLTVFSGHAASFCAGFSLRLGLRQHLHTQQTKNTETAWNINA